MTNTTETALAGTATALPTPVNHEVWIEHVYPKKFTVYVPRPAMCLEDEESDAWFEARISLAVGVMGIFDQLERCGYPRRMLDRVAWDVATGAHDDLLEDDEEPDGGSDDA